MTHPNNVQSAATRTAASLSQRLQRLMVVVVTALFGTTLTSLSFAASSPPHQLHPTTKPHAAAPRPSPHASATTPKAKAKPAVAQHPTQQRKTPAKTRVAAKSKTPTRAHQPPRKPSKLATKQTKHSA